ncbi:SDR family oxidoreductase [Herpetosiphon sp. NSE202]|uniref:SDR family oxidoreductase n=1 Tax=Herpetosiphon sp. NSE202 TaxID=3351349 RepID=UPI00362C6F4D
MQRIGLITGASRGLGLALAQKLALDGWHLIITGRGAAALEQARAALATRTSVQAIDGDIADPAHRQALAIAAQEWGGLDLLVNNASILGPSPLPSLVEYPLAELAQVYTINVFAPLAAIQTLAPSFKPSIRIINISSDAALQAYEGWGGYGSSKAALDQLTAILAAEQPTWRVYSLDPGDMNTQMHQEAFPGEDISDRPPPEASVPAVLRLINDDVPSGRYRKD